MHAVAVVFGKGFGEEFFQIFRSGFVAQDGLAGMLVVNLLEYLRQRNVVVLGENGDFSQRADLGGCRGAGADAAAELLDDDAVLALRDELVQPALSRNSQYLFQFHSRKGLNPEQI